MRHVRHPDSRLWIALALGLWQGVVGEGLLFAWAQARRAQEALAADFRLLALLSEGLDEERLNMARERLLFLPDTQAVEYVPRERALEGLAVRDPELARAVSLLGENPLPAGFEVRLTPDGVARLSGWLEAAGRIAEIARIEYRAPQAQAILQARADARYLALLLSLGLWGLALGSFFYLIPGFAEPERLLHTLWESLPMPVWGAGGGAIGTGAALALALPLNSGSPFWVWPPTWGLALLVAGGAMAGWIADRLLP